MDILKPELLWMGSRCYRINPIANEDLASVGQPKITTEYIENDLYGEDADEDEYVVIEQGPSRFKTTFHVASAFFGVIIGAKAATKRRIEGETRTQIKIPKQGMTGDVEITGASRDNVCSARRRVEMIVLASRSKQSPTHFVTIRISDPEIRRNYERFMNDIIHGPPIFGLRKTMFMPPEKLHITISVMALMDDDDRKLATQLLLDCLENVINPAKKQFDRINVKVAGVAILNDDPSEVNVLYGKIESEPLQMIVDGINEHFISRGLARREFERDNVKMHMTLINTKYDKANETDGDDTTSKHRQQKVKATFDARSILETYGNHQFGNQDINEIQLCLMHSNGCDGFYQSSTSIKF